MERSPTRLVGQLKTLMELSALVNSTLSSVEIRQRAVEAAATLLEAERSSLLLLDPASGDLCFEVAIGEGGDTLKEVRLLKGQGIAGWVAEHGEPLVVNDTHADPRFYRNADLVSHYVTRNMVCVPVSTKGRMVGVLQVMNRDDDFLAQDAELLLALAHQVAVAIENANLFAELQETFFQTAAALADTIEKRDPYTGGHTQRVMTYATHVAQRMGLSEEEVADLRLSAILHDIGKVGVPDEVLRKPGRLSDEEFAVMRRHSEMSAEILGHVRRLSHVLPGVRWHHERMDGKGYPDGLVGDEIPVAARIIAVADAFDAMTSARPYRIAMRVSDAIEELRRCSGTQFDETAATALIELLDEHGLLLLLGDE